jgi:2-polyprenyl-6-methoxyphenol hydroxylase-like FAD-dependent oxidoreductase
MIPVGVFGGGMLGVALALALELFGRRVRSSEDLRDASNSPVLAVVTRPHTRTGLHLRDRVKRWFMRSRRPRLRAAKA